ncbi:hypothetical protein G7067_04935 [Leucobacter insecticola]|uniref:Uncharacterized protein n=1 Tax=Leucobacter insecticola TaxID=2714934 RepID=A0A6G8FIN1_9MICO|nr:hypothetical protein [Leucobacter insecticola]QIM15912.1 hypothetical protein G7067_04935 [Leucobacter insecticola]
MVALSAIPMLFNLFTPSVFGWSTAPWGIFGFPAWLSTTIAWLVWIAIIVVAWIWLYRVARNRNRTGRAEAWQGAADTASAGSTSDAWGEDSGNKANAWGEDFGKKADAWGESFGKKADAWGENFGHRAEHWGTQYEQHHEARKLGAAHVLITFALALLAAGGAAIWAHSAGSPVPGLAGTAIASLVAALAVFALSLIVAGIRGRNTGWIGFLSACGVVTLLFTSVLPWGTQFQLFGTLSSGGQNAPGAVLLAGNTSLDLNSLDSEDINDQENFTIWQFAGNSTVTLPETHPVVVDVRVLGGNIRESGATTSRAAGPLLAKTFSNTAENNDSATRVTIYLVFGNARVVVPDEKSSGTADTKKPSANQATTEQLEQLTAELEKVEWQLEEPGLSKAEQRSLEAERTQLKQDIKDLELEMAR